MEFIFNVSDMDCPLSEQCTLEHNAIIPVDEIAKVLKTDYNYVTQLPEEHPMLLLIRVDDPLFDRGKIRHLKLEIPEDEESLAENQLAFVLAPLTVFGGKNNDLMYDYSYIRRMAELWKESDRLEKWSVGETILRVLSLIESEK